MKHTAIARMTARLTCAFVALCVLFCPFLKAGAEVEAPIIDSPYALVYNVQYSEVLYEKNADERIAPASFAKVMTAILAYEYKAEVGSPAPVIVDEEEAAAARGGLYRIQAGEQFAFDDLLCALVIGNANNAAYLLAKTVSGDVDTFVARMNERARELGAEQTHFANPTGLDDNSAYTTLSDMAKICEAANTINDYMVTSSKLYYEIAPTELTKQKRTVFNNNLILDAVPNVVDGVESFNYYIEGAVGINCGGTKEAGDCLATAKEGDASTTNLVLLSGGVTNESGLKTTFLDAKKLFSYAEEAYEVQTVLAAGSIIQEIPVDLADAQDHVMLIASADITALLPVDAQIDEKIVREIYTTEKRLEAPVVEGTAHGSIEIYYEDELIGSAELLAQRSISRSAPLYLLDNVKGFSQKPLVRLILIVLAVAIVLFLAACLILLWIQKQQNSKLSPTEKRRLKKQQKELLFKEKLRQQEYIDQMRVERKKRSARRKQVRRAILQQRKKEAAEAARRAAARPQGRQPQAQAARRPAQGPAQPRRTSAPGQLPKPAEGSTRPAPPRRNPPQGKRPPQKK